MVIFDSNRNNKHKGNWSSISVLIKMHNIHRLCTFYDTTYLELLPVLSNTNRETDFLGFVRQKIKRSKMAISTKLAIVLWVSVP